MARRAVIGSLGLLCLALGGCEGSNPEAEARLERVKAQGLELEGALGDVEERLLGNQATVKLWSELAVRHKQVTQVACQNLASHVEGMQAHLEKQDKKKKRVRRSRVAQEVSAAPVRGRKSRRN